MEQERERLPADVALCQHWTYRTIRMSTVDLSREERSEWSYNRARRAVLTALRIRRTAPVRNVLDGQRRLTLIEDTLINESNRK